MSMVERRWSIVEGLWSKLTNSITQQLNNSSDGSGSQEAEQIGKGVLARPASSPEALVSKSDLRTIHEKERREGP